MGRAKIEIAKLQSEAHRMTTFSKRRRGLIKKAYEISVLCDVAAAVITFTPHKSRPESVGRKVTFFASHYRYEDVYIRYLRDEIQKDEDESKKDPRNRDNNRIMIHDKEGLIARLENLKIQDDNHKLEQGEPRLRNQEGSSSSIQTLKHGMQSPPDLQMEQMKQQLLRTADNFEFLNLYMWFYKSYKDTLSKNSVVWAYCQMRLIDIRAQILKEKENLEKQEQQQQQQQIWEYNNLGSLNMIKQEQQQPQQTSVHGHQTLVEAFQQQRKGKMVVTKGNPSSSSHMHQAQMTSQYLNSNIQLHVPTHQAPMQPSFQSTLGTQQEPMWCLREDECTFIPNNIYHGMESGCYTVLEEMNRGPIQCPVMTMSSHGEASTTNLTIPTSTSYNPTTQTTGLNSYRNQQQFGGYEADVNTFYNSSDGHYQDYNNNNKHGPQFNINNAIN